MKVFVVTHMIPFEGEQVKGVFSTREKAVAYSEEAKRRNIEDWAGVDVEDEEFPVEEMEVQGE